MQHGRGPSNPSPSPFTIALTLISSLSSSALIT
jgi:hypothetical protein